MRTFDRAYAKIHLDRIKSNMEAMTNNLTPGTKIIGVVKADGYGHGAVPVAKTIDPYVTGFAVAAAEEGYQLRRYGIRKEILVLTYEYLFPMRAIEGIEVYKKWYDDTLYTHNPRTNAQRSVDIHTEMCRRTLPSIMPLSEQSSPSINCTLPLEKAPMAPTPMKNAGFLLQSKG